MTWVIEALQPVSFLQIGMMWQLPDGDYGAVTVRSVRSLDEAVGALVQYEFDAIILGSAVMDTWPTAAYEQIAQLAGATPVLVQTYFIGPMTDIKQQQDREQPYCGVVRSPKSQARRSGKHSLPIVASRAQERRLLRRRRAGRKTPRHGVLGQAGASAWMAENNPTPSNWPRL